MRALAFDVFGTLLDPAAIVRALPASVADPVGFAAAWRAKQLEYSFLLTAMDRYLPFSEVTARALRHTARAHGVGLDAAEFERLLVLWTSLPPYPDAREGLASLRERLTVAVLSNGDPPVLEAALRHAGLRDLVDPVISAAEARALKPSPRVYARAAERLGVPIADIALVSSNPFDVIGARTAKMRAIWVNRSAGPFDDLDVAPEAEVRTLRELAESVLPESRGHPSRRISSRRGPK